MSHSGKVLWRDSDQSTTVIDCTHCQYAHVDPIPSVQEVEAFYQEDFYQTEKPDYCSRYLQDKEWWDSVYQERLGLLSEHTTGRNLLDVGSGPGLFVNQAAKSGWNATGVEPSRVAVEFASQFSGNFIHGFFDENIATKLGKFDVVHMHEVLEHVREPASLITLARSVLNKDGIIYIMVPNDFNPFQNALHNHGRFPAWWVNTQHHLNYFNKDSLSQLLSKSGFEVLHCEVSFPIDIFLMMGRNYIGDDQVGRQCHSLRKTFELNLAAFGLGALKRQLYDAFANLGLGREVGICARKV